MRYTLKTPLALSGERVEVGTEVDLNQEEVARLDPSDISPVDGVAVVEEEVVEEVALEDMTLNQLKARAAELGLSTAGSKADLVERITLHLAGESTGEEEVEEEVEEEEEVTNDQD